MAFLQITIHLCSFMFSLYHAVEIRP